MTKKIAGVWFLFAASLGLWSADVAAAAEKPEKDAGWIVLFDGTNLNAWQDPSAKRWKIVDGVLAWEKGCGNLWTKDQFGDFILELEVKCAKNTNSGVFLRSPQGEKNWLQGSIEIQVLGSYGKEKPSKHDMGSIYDCLAPSVSAEKPLGEWNAMQIDFRGNKLKITLNGQRIIDADLDQWTTAGKNPDGTPNKFTTAYKDMAKRGHLGLQDHGQPVWYRNIRVKPL